MRVFPVFFAGIVSVMVVGCASFGPFRSDESKVPRADLYVPDRIARGFEVHIEWEVEYVDSTQSELWFYDLNTAEWLLVDRTAVLVTDEDVEAYYARFGFHWTGEWKMIVYYWHDGGIRDFIVKRFSVVWPIEGG